MDKEKNRFNVEEHTTLDGRIIDVFPISHRYIHNLEQENKKLKDNWNELREWIVYNKHNENTEQHYLVVDYGTLLGKMRELEGSANNE